MKLKFNNDLKTSGSYISTLKLAICMYNVRNILSVSQSLILDRIDKFKHYIRINIHNTIVLRFWN